MQISLSEMQAWCIPAAEGGEAGEGAEAAAEGGGGGGGGPYLEVTLLEAGGGADSGRGGSRQPAEPTSIDAAAAAAEPAAAAAEPTAAKSDRDRCQRHPRPRLPPAARARRLWRWPDLR